MYRDVPYRKLDLAAVAAIVEAEARCDPRAKRIFLADGDVMRRPFAELEAILSLLGSRYPRLARVGLYANGSSILSKSDAELRALRKLKLHTLYMGMESGDEEVLEDCHKGETAADMVTAAQRAAGGGLRMSVMILLGLGGARRSTQHAENSAAAINAMQPRLLSTLRVIPLPGTELYEDASAGRFQQLTEYEAVRELRVLLSQLELDGTVFRSNHTSNVAPLEGRLPKDKARMVRALDRLMQDGTLDRRTPGRMPFSL
jgi:radical SAM superfamily enzyme YgiQ (UPF0313 family)